MDFEVIEKHRRLGRINVTRNRFLERMRAATFLRLTERVQFPIRVHRARVTNVMYQCVQGKLKR